jgi:hypothetical protein
MKMEQTQCSETLAYKIQTPGNYPEVNIQQFLDCLLNKDYYYYYQIYPLIFPTSEYQTGPVLADEMPIVP